MVNSSEEILLTLGARNNASSVFSQVDRDAKSMASSISSAMSSINNSMMNFSQVTDNMMQSLTGKSALDNILGTTSKAETNKVLVNMMTETEDAAKSLYKTVDDVTNTSLTSMQDLIPAMNAFKSATGASDTALESVTDEMANFGAAVLAQTGSTDLAQQAMMDLSKGIKGAFASLDQYGVSEDALKRTGLWSGKEDDVEGYMAAVEKVIGSTDELMQTNQGLDALIGKAFSRAGKKIGNEFLPIIKDIKNGFLDLDTALGGNLTASILAVSGGVELMNRGFWNVSTTVQGFKDLSEGASFLITKIKGVEDAAKSATSALETMGNVSSIGADISGTSGTIGASADIVKTTSKTEKAVDSGIEALTIADLIKDNKSAQKDAEKLLKELGYTDKLGDKVQKYSTQVYNPTKWTNYENYEKIRDVGNFGETNGGLKKFIEDAKTGREDASNLIKELSSSKSEMDVLQNELDDIQIPKSNFQKMGDWFKGLFKGADEVADVTKSMDGAKAISEGVEEVAEMGTAMTAAGPALDAGAAGAEAAAAGSAGLAASFTSMIVPLLAISAVIIIMIPIVAVIAAEAMIFIRLLADFMEALNFDNINLDGAIKGISQVATALAWVGVAMAAMSFTSIMTGLAVVTGGFLGITGPLDVAVKAIKDAGSKLSQFNSLTINPSVPDNIKKISDSLMSVSNAMMALTSTTITTGFSNFVAWAFGFGSVTSALEQAKNDIFEASSKLNEFSSLTPLDDNVAKNIQNVCDSLASVGDAISALRSIRDGQNWDNLIGDLMSGLFGEGLNIGQALDKVKGDITDASIALKKWDGLEEIPEGLGDKIKKVSEALKSVSEAFETLRGFRDNNIWDDMIGGIFGDTDIKTALGKVMEDINTASTKLSELSIGDNINEDLINKIQNVVNALTKVSEACSTLTNLPPMEGFDSTQITTAVTNVQTAATELARLNQTTFDGTTADTILGAIQTTLENLKNTLAAASGFTECSINIGTQIVSGVQSGLSPLSGIVQSEVTTAINSAIGSASTGGASIGTSITDGFKSTLKLADVMTTEMGYVKTAVDDGISAAKSAAESGAKEVVEAFKSGVNVGSPGDIARTMEQEMIYTRGFIVGSVGFLKDAAFSAARSIVESFGNPMLNIGSNFSMGNIDALGTITSRIPENLSNQNVTIIVSEGAVQLDARDMTAKESQQILITALESLDNITSIQTNGV